MTFEKTSHSMESKLLILNLMRMSREKIGDNKQLVEKLGFAALTGIIEIRASTIRWILNVRVQSLPNVFEVVIKIHSNDVL